MTSGSMFTEETSDFWALELYISKLVQSSCASSRLLPDSEQLIASVTTLWSKQRGQVCVLAWASTHAIREGQWENHLFLEINNKTTCEMVKNPGLYVT